MAERLEDLDPGLAESVNSAINAIDQALGNPPTIVRRSDGEWDGERWKGINELRDEQERENRRNQEST